MAVSINPLIISRIEELDEPEKFKELLISMLEFEKLQTNKGDRDYTRKYDQSVTEFFKSVG